jgi:hypothetical protein
VDELSSTELPMLETLDLEGNRMIAMSSIKVTSLKSINLVSEADTFFFHCLPPFHPLSFSETTHVIENGSVELIVCIARDERVRNLRSTPFQCFVLYVGLVYAIHTHRTPCR